MIKLLERKFFRKTPVKLPPRKFGLIEVIPEPTDYVFGSNTSALKMMLFPERDSTAYLPAKEKQEFGFDSFSCVTYSALNCLEVLHKKLFGVEINASDRFTAAISGTIPGQGNSFTKVGDAIRKYGLALEQDYPWGGNNNTEYLQKPPQAVIEKAKVWLQAFETQYEWVGWGGVKPDNLYNALQFGPVQVSVDSNATYTGEFSTATNHAVTVYKSVYKKSFGIFDHYDRTTYDLPWNFYFGSATQHSLIKKKFLPLVQVYGKTEIYAIIGSTAHHVANENTWHYGESIGIWEKQIQIVTAKTFADTFTVGKQIIFN